MKKIYSLLVLFFFSFAVKSQTDFTIGQASGVNDGSTYPAPIQDFYEGSRSQYLYTASEMQAAGMGPGFLLSLKFDVTTLNTFSGIVPQYTIAIGTTATTSLTNTDWELGTVNVYGPVDYVPTVGINEFTFSSPFFWNGTDNIIVEICNGVTPNNTFTDWTSNPSSPWTTGLAFNGSHTYRADNIGNLCGTATTTNFGLQTSRPDIIFSWNSPVACSGMPTAGNTVSSKDSVCPLQPFIVTTNGSTLGSGLTYLWESSTDGVNYNPAAGANTNFSYQVPAGISVNTWYRRKITCTTNTSTSVAKMVYVKPFYECYCNPATNTTLHSGITNPTIESVAISGGTVNYINSHPGANPAPTLGYAAFTDASGVNNPAIPVLKQATTYTLTLGTSTTPVANAAGYWIDWNHNQVYDSAEYVSIPFTAGNLTADVAIEVPENATLGLTMMRIRTRTFAFNYSNPCTSFTAGETEEYIFRVDPGVPCTGTPIGGTTASAVASICPNKPFLVTVTGATEGVTNLSYQWEVSTNNGVSFNPIVGATKKTLSVTGITAATCYRRKITCGASSSYSANLCMPISAIISCYCSPANGTTLHSSTSPTIQQVDITGGTVSYSNQHPGAATAPTLGYVLFDDSTNFSLAQAVSYSLTLTTSARPGKAAVWFDWDRSGTFDATEYQEIVFAAGSTSETVNIDVPIGASLGATAMRIRIRAATFTTNACENYGSGETEDYAFTVVPGAPCTGTPLGGTAESSLPSVCSNSSFTLSTTGGTEGVTNLTYRWEYSTNNGTTWDTVPNGTSRNLVMTGMTVPTCYRRKITCNGTSSSYSTQVCVATNPFYECYCSPNTGNTLHTNSATPTIESVSVVGGTVNYSNSHSGSNPAPTLGYAAFVDSTSMFSLKQGGTYTVTLATSATPVANAAGCWVDWNRNNLFDSAEFINIPFVSGSTSADLNFEVPANAPLGLTVVRFRVRNFAFNYANPCLSFTNGETEDYIFKVLPGTACSGSPVGGVTESSNASICPTRPFNLSVTGSTSGVTNLTYQWESSPSCGGTYTPIAGATSKTLAIAGITANTSYRRKITCGGSSSYSTPICITMNATTSCYCSPLTGIQLHTFTGPSIEQVDVSGGVVAYTNQHAGANADPNSLGYVLFDDTTSSFTLSQTYSYTLTVNTSATPGQAAVWFDWNRNGTFETSEYSIISFPAGSTTASFTINVPTTASIGITLMRVRVRSATFTSDACERYGSGETEDYSFRVIAPPVCSGKPLGGATSSTVSLVCNNTPIVLSVANASEGVLGLTYQWQDSIAGGSWQNIAGETGLGLSTYQSVAKYYRRKIKCTPSNDSSYSTNIFINQVPLTYASLPFTESFEAVWIDGCGNTASRNIPNNSWRNGYLMTDSSWRRNDDGISANWTNASTGVYVPSASAGAYSARFHSANVFNKSGNLDLHLNCNSGVATKRLSFDFLNTGGNDSMQVLLSTDAGVSFNKIAVAKVASSWTTQIIDFSSNSATTIIRFKVNGDFSVSDFGLDNVGVVVLYPTDLMAVSVASPTGSLPFTTSGTITLNVKNTGSNTINFATTPITVGARVTNPASITTPYNNTISTGTLAAGASTVLPVATNANFGTIGTYAIKAGFTLTGDGNAVNDSTGQTNFNATSLVVFAVANGNWGDGSTWNTGVPPTSGDTVNITGYTVSLGGALPSPYVAGSVGVGLGGNLVAATGVLNIGPAGGGNKAFTLAKGASLQVSGGTINHNGFFLANDSSNITMSAGDFRIDGNDGTDVGSIQAGINLFTIGGTTNYSNGNLSFSGGNLIFADPHRFGGVCFGYKGAVAKNLGAGHSIILGDAASTHTASTGTAGFSINTLLGGARMTLGRLVANGGNTVGNRFGSLTGGNIGFNGDVVVNANSELRFNQTPYLAGNLTNNGVFACSTSPNFQTYFAGVAGPVQNAQTISGNGIYRNTIPAVAISNSGSGYSVGDVLTISGGTSTTAATIYVSAINAGGSIASAVLLGMGNYTVAPTGANAVTGGTGSGATFTPTNFISIATFTGLTINNSNAAGVTVSSFGTALPTQTATISGTGGVLTLVSGALNNGSNIVTVGNSLTARGSINQTFGYVTGKLRRWFATATNTGTSGDMPVGKGGVSRNARVEFTTAPTKGGILTAEFIATAPGLNGFPVTDGALSLIHIANDGYWKLESDSIVGGTYTLSLTDSGYTTVQTLANLRSVNRADAATNWSVSGNAGTNTGTLIKPVVVRTGLTGGFREFAVAGSTENTLPFTSIKFTGEKVGNINQLKWTVINEIDVKSYELQRSLNGTTFNSIANVVSKANNNVVAPKLDYSFDDNNSIANDGYYRVKQIAKDGSVSYSNIVLIKGLKVSGLVVGNIYPNPAKHFLNLVVAASTARNVTVSIATVDGKQVIKSVYTLNAGDNNLKINLDNVAAGSYSLIVTDANGNKSNISKFIKE